MGHSYCTSELHLDLTLGRLERKLADAIARTTEAGSRCLVLGASAGPASHGRYVCDGRLVPVGGLAKGEKGAALQKRVWAEFKDKLEAIEPGVTSSIEPASVSEVTSSSRC